MGGREQQLCEVRGESDIRFMESRARKREREKEGERDNAIYRRGGHGEYKIKTCHGRSPPWGVLLMLLSQCGSYAQIS